MHAPKTTKAFSLPKSSKQNIAPKKKPFKNICLYTPSVTTILRRPTGIRSLPTTKT